MSRFTFDPTAAAQVPRPYQVDLVTALAQATTPIVPGDRLRVQVATGGGKNAIINDFIAGHALPRGLRILCVTNDWRLLGQQASDLCRRHAGAASRIGYVGVGGETEFVGVCASAHAQVVYSTIQTWESRCDQEFTDATFGLIVIDEHHWGDDARIYKRLLERSADRAAFIGLSATPRQGTSFRLVGEAYDFPRLVRLDVLARPVVIPVTTGVTWSPGQTNRNGDVTPGSLRELGENDARNQLIVDHYLEHRKRYGRTLVFACDVAHADRLSDRMAVAGVRVGALHARVPVLRQKRVLSDFRSGAIDVLINVQMATTGLDVPDIRTLLMTRPTTSEILAAQMVGRGSRKTPTKTHFNVVDFVDIVTTPGIELVRPDGYFGVRRGSLNRGPRLPHHDFEPAPLELLAGEPGYEALAGLELNPSQTFGVEFEFHAPDGAFERVAPKILKALRDANFLVADRHRTDHSWSGSQHGKDNSVWNVEPDPSCGVEVTSRILRGAQGFREIIDACAVLGPLAQQLGLQVAHPSVGTHIHLGWSPEASALRRLMLTAAYYEPAILSLVAPSRARNVHVQMVRKSIPAMLELTNTEGWRSMFEGHRRKYVAVNPSHLFSGYGTVEVRYHSGTSDAPKILAWISLWMRVLASAHDANAQPGDPRARVRSRPLTTGRRGDIREMCGWLGAGDALTERLVARRNDVVRRWWTADPRYAALAERTLAYWEASSGDRNGARPASPAPGRAAQETAA